MPQHSAGLLPYGWDAAGVRVFLVHPGGPLWARKDAGAWSLAKGLYEPGAEDPLDAARREFAEEVGVPAPAGDEIALGEVRLKSGKRIRAFAVPAPADLAWVASNTFEMPWPPRSGRVGTFPEVDRGAWFAVEDARVRINAGQAPLLDALEDAVGQRL